ncbi:VanZ family protein [Paenibacillus aurantius]|uniref:VanZ family protein n=1 Tax=Paenibacillus aurantius TaxID=2918900 RepID=A0AA96LHY1_9BACL|nr:VanZ family protein [Paenibacillus aurantius]WNQ13628.1 VanZ family protein [Paenibacillus aurantius]
MKRYAALLPCLIMMGLIFYFSSRTGDELDSVLPFFQHLFPGMKGFDGGHFVAYFLLALTYLWSFRTPRPPWVVKAAVVLLCLLYGVTDEFHQMFVPKRSPDFHDLRNDGIGAALAMLFVSSPPVAKAYAKLHYSSKSQSVKEGFSQRK